MKVLFLASSVDDYLSDGLLHGLRSLLGSDVVDFPKAERLYRSCPPVTLEKMHGRGFTLYGLLEDSPVDRHGAYWRILEGEFDLVVVGDVYREFGTFVQVLADLCPERTALIDGADQESIYPYAGKWWRRPYYWFLPRANRFRYFKRELTPRSLHYRWFRAVPEEVCKRLPFPKNWLPIAFSIPAEKILSSSPVKDQVFGRHVVDLEVAARIPGCSVEYPFSNEADYYADLRRSKFGITTKRAGWDCLRHYELAANACVPCFRDLDRKPASCAPHGLSTDNCIVYHDYDDLQRQISGISDTRYEQLQAATLRWAGENTTIERAKQLLRTFDPGILQGAAH